MKLSDRIAAIEARASYVADSLTDTADPTDSSVHIILYQVQGHKKQLNPDGTMTDLGPADPVDVKEVWRGYNAGQESEYIERIA